MFDDAPFRNRIMAVVGAAVLGVLFAVVALLVERLTGGAFVVTPAVLALAGAAFVGYLALAAFLSRVPPS